MVEILGNHLMRFMVAMSDHKEYERHQRTYKGERYEVWEVSDDLFKDMCDITEEMFVDLAGEDAWWRSAIGSNLGAPNATYIIKGHRLLVWECHDRSDWCGNCECDDEESCVECMDYSREFSSLSEYLCNEVGASVEKNVCACAIDLAKYNNMTMGELFSKYEG